VVPTAIVLLALIALMAAAWYRYGRATWHTYTSPPDPECFGYALAVEMPEGWTARTERPGLVLLRPRPPVGPARWWHQYILHDLSGNPLAQEVVVTLTAYPLGNMSADQYFSVTERMVPRFRARGRQLTTRRLHHPLGPALELWLPFSSRGASQMQVHYGQQIIVPEKRDDKTMVISFGASMKQVDFARDRSLLQQIARRIRIVRK
jgi:hypothetical protein